MGIYCKKSSPPPNTSSHKIHKIKSNLLKNKENKFEFLTFDIIEEKIYINKIKFHIITSLKGLSQLNQENSIFLCGGLNEKPYSGSFLIRINYNIIMENSIKFLINSQYVHEYPSMLYIGDNLIIIIGGKNQIKCECFDYEYNKWSNLPDLPEERYLCSLCLDNAKKYVYLFGGFNNNLKCNIGNILRMDIYEQLYWEKILIKDNDSKCYLMKNSCGTFAFNNDILILGGENNFGNLTNDIIKYDIKNNLVLKIAFSLQKNGKFTNQSGVNVNDLYFVFFDDDDYIHKIYSDDINYLDND